MPTTVPAAAPGVGPGLVRRVRRQADLSQRDLAARLAGLRVALVDETATPVPPMRRDAARDRAGRRYPAHVDPTARGWWMPPGSHLSVAGITACRRSREERVPQVSYDTGPWRSVLRDLLGTPDDHPTLAQLVARVEERTGETTRAGPRRAD